MLFKYIDKNEIEKEITLKVKGVTNSSYQDFIISSDIEKEIYRDMGLSDQEITAISFTVSLFRYFFKFNEVIYVFIIYSCCSWVSGFISNFI